MGRLDTHCGRCCAERIVDRGFEDIGGSGCQFGGGTAHPTGTRKCPGRGEADEKARRGRGENRDVIDRRAKQFDANVKLDAYDSSIFGALYGKVSYISPDVLTEETRQGPLIFYRVRIRITGTEFKGAKAHEIQVRPGLTGNVEIKALERTVLSYLTKPISKTFSQSMGER